MMRIGIILAFLTGATYLMNQLSPIHKFSPSEVHIKINTEDIKPICSQTIVSCKINADCLLCQEPGMTCYKGKCIHPQALPSCNIKNGGLEVLTLSPVNQLKFECVCLYPNFFTGSTCDIQNKHVCQQGILNIDFTHEIPGMDNCTCPAGHAVKLLHRHFNHSYPICVPNTSTWIEKYK